MPSIPLRPYALQYVLDKLVEQSRAAGRAEAHLEEAENRILRAVQAQEAITKAYFEIEAKLHDQARTQAGAADSIPEGNATGTAAPPARE